MKSHSLEEVEVHAPSALFPNCSRMTSNPEVGQMFCNSAAISAAYVYRCPVDAKALKRHLSNRHSSPGKMTSRNVKPSRFGCYLYSVVKDPLAKYG
jgi:hypothetical protein